MSCPFLSSVHYLAISTHVSAQVWLTLYSDLNSLLNNNLTSATTYLKWIIQYFIEIICYPCIIFIKCCTEHMVDLKNGLLFIIILILVWVSSPMPVNWLYNIICIASVNNGIWMICIVVWIIMYVRKDNTWLRRARLGNWHYRIDADVSVARIFS